MAKTTNDSIKLTKFGKKSDVAEDIVNKKTTVHKSSYSMDINNMPTTFIKYNINNSDSSIDDLNNDLIELNNKEAENMTNTEKTVEKKITKTNINRKNVNIIE
jgi:hypothetical protein